MKRTKPEIPETKPDRPKRAAAIRYDAAKDDAPRVTAKGSGHVARRIIELARR
ncbi:MAG TPA: EscU/YscU/HrcU family type III secretion system export apparatus switch protein, partial [Syntrophales bacterium]|nr:EscU/YscU/HrcU family type III secretion system export apparatus switch protein [Syntrophales bacterium]HQC24529.1 EscU/YscU/HrcU family type III secretion system export apparatus switch protein [Syntrophales bacterium]HQM92158.1 EscU/YscU/HrcU family type III secretion system export apparatus switch protein [Syntrophales bacterium]